MRALRMTIERVRLPSVFRPFDRLRVSGKKHRQLYGYFATLRMT